jgi:hypothetical protein
VVVAAAADAIAAGIFALLGVLVAGVVGWVSSWQTHRRTAAYALVERQRDERKRFADLLREGVIGVNQAWAEVVRADAARAHDGEMSDSEKAARERTVHALTELGACFNGILVLPISAELESMVLDCDKAVSQFREAEFNPTWRLEGRQLVGQKLLELIRFARGEGTV